MGLRGQSFKIGFCGRVDHVIEFSRVLQKYCDTDENQGIENWLSQDATASPPKENREALKSKRFDPHVAE